MNLQTYDWRERNMSLQTYKSNLTTFSNSRIIAEYRTVLETSNTMTDEQFHLKIDAVDTELQSRMMPFLDKEVRPGDVDRFTSDELLGMYDRLHHLIHARDEKEDKLYFQAVRKRIADLLEESPTPAQAEKGSMQGLVNTLLELRAQTSAIEDEIFKRLEAVR